MSYGRSVAASVREQKEKHPELFCAHPKCLWRIVDRFGNSMPCQSTKHPHYAKPMTTSEAGAAFGPVMP